MAEFQVQLVRRLEIALTVIIDADTADAARAEAEAYLAAHALAWKVTDAAGFEDMGMVWRPRTDEASVEDVKAAETP